MIKPERRATTFLFGIVFAVVGFSIAIATSNRSAPESPLIVEGRSLSSNLNFANARLSNGNRDLGDAVVGSACFVRTIGVLGGLPPYTFSITSNANGVTADSLALVSTPMAGLFGTALGANIPNATVAGPLTFGVTALDSMSSNANASFTLNILSGQNQFRFALGQLNDGQQFRDYQCSLPVINGKAPYNFGVVSGSVLAGGKAQSGLGAIGLALTPDGKVIGQPLVAGTVTFTAACTDATGAFARSRGGATLNQVVTLNILANAVISNTVVVTAFSASGDTSVGGKDKMSITAQVNLNGQPISSLTGPITIRVLNYEVATGTLSKGKFSLAHGGSTRTATAKGSVNANGQLKFTVSNENFGTRSQLGTIGTSNTLPIEIVVGNVVDGMSLINASAKSQRGTRFSMQYRLGRIPRGGSSGTLAGAFILTGVTGKDDTKGGTGDSWKVAFLAVPESGSSFGNAGSSATVSIGTRFSDTETTSARNGSIKTGRIDPKSTNKVTRLSMSDKGKGSYQTGSLDAALTGITQANKSTIGVNYSTEIDLGTSYGGAGVEAIFPKKSQWSSKNPSK